MYINDNSNNTIDTAATNNHHIMMIIMIMIMIMIIIRIQIQLLLRILLIIGSPSAPSSAPSAHAPALGAKYFTPEITKVKFHWQNDSENPR